MNSPATIFFRACRAQPSRSLILRSSSTGTPLLASTRKATQQQCRRALGQRAAFSSRCLLHQAQPINDISSPSQERAQNHPSSASASSSPKTSAAARDDAAFLASSYKLTGRVSRVGTMRKTVRVSRTVQVWDRYLQKYWKREAHELVHDTEDILNEGDIITYGPFPPNMHDVREGRGQLGGKNRVRFVLREVVTPFGTPVEQRVSRVVGSPEGRWKGGPGQVLKIAVRIRGKGKGKGKGKAKVDVTPAAASKGDAEAVRTAA